MKRIIALVLIIMSTSILVHAYYEPSFSYCIDPNEQAPNAAGYCAFLEKNYGNYYFSCQETPGAPGQQMNCVGNLLIATPI